MAQQIFRKPLSTLNENPNKQWNSSSPPPFKTNNNSRSIRLLTKEKPQSSYGNHQQGPFINWDSQHHPKYYEMLKVTSVNHFKRMFNIGNSSNSRSPVHSPSSSEWDIPIQVTNINVKGMNRDFHLRKKFQTSAQMELKILSSMVRKSGSPNRSPLSNSKNKGCSPKSSCVRIWAATFITPFSYAFGASFFKNFPQKNLVSVTIGHQDEDNCLLFTILSSEPHSLGTIVRKIQNKVISLSGIEDIRFEELEGRIRAILSRQRDGEIKMTTIRHSFEDSFKTVLVPSLFGVRWVKDLMALLVNTVKLEPLADDVLIKFADEESIAKAISEKKDLAATVHRSMTMQASEESKLNSLKDITLSLMSPLIRNNLVANSFFDNEFGQVLVVLENLGLLNKFFQNVEQSCVAEFDRSPVAWLDGIARAMLRNLLDFKKKDDDSNENETEQSTAEAAEEISTRLEDNSWKTQEIYENTTVNNITQKNENVVRSIASASADQMQPQRVNRWEAASLATVLPPPSIPQFLCWSQFTSVFDNLLDSSSAASYENSTTSIMLVDVGDADLDISFTPSPEVESTPSAEFSLFSTSPFLYQMNDSQWKSGFHLSPKNLSQEFISVDSLKNNPAKDLEIGNENNGSNNKIQSENNLEKLTSVLQLGEDACKALKDANIDSVDALLHLGEDSLKFIDLKKAPMIRLRAWLEKVRSNLMKPVKVDSPVGFIV